MKNARQLMTPQPRVIGSGESLEYATRFFLTYHVHYAPIISPMGEVLGMLSDVAMVKASLRKYISSDHGDSVYGHKDLFEPALTIRDTASLEEVVRVMMKAASRRVLVLDPGLTLAGIISPRDILKVLSGKAEELNQMHMDLKDIEFKARQLELEVQSIHQLMSVYREIFEASPLIMHSVDAQGMIVMANRKAHESLGYLPNELIHKSIFDLYPQQVHVMARQGLETIRQTGEHKTTMTAMVRKDGSMMHVDLVSSSLKSPKGVFLGTITAARPVVESRTILETIDQLLGGELPE